MQFFKKAIPIITEEDNRELREIRRNAYMEEARKLIQEKAREQARKDFEIKQKNEGF